MYHRLQRKLSRRWLITDDGSLIGAPAAISRHFDSTVLHCCRGREGGLQREDARVVCVVDSTKKQEREETGSYPPHFSPPSTASPTAKAAAARYRPIKFLLRAPYLTNIVIDIVYRAGRHRRLHNSGVCLDQRVSRLEKERGNRARSETEMQEDRCGMEGDISSERS